MKRMCGAALFGRDAPPVTFHKRVKMVNVSRSAAIFVYPANVVVLPEKSSSTVLTVADVLCGKYKPNVTLGRSVCQGAHVVNA